MPRPRPFFFVLIASASSFLLVAAGAGVAPQLPPQVRSAAPPAKTSRSGYSPVPVYKDVARDIGLTASHISTPEKRYIIESMSGGVGLFDCDNDGRLDAVMVNGSSVERFRHGGDPLVTLYHQEPDGTFKDMTKLAGLTRPGWGMGVAVADYDNDGWLDLFVTGYGGSALYHNLGNCKFEDVTEKAGVRGSGFMTGAAWGDYDRDGFVDLYVSRYVHVDIERLPEFGSNKFCRYKGILVQCGPWGLEGESDFLYHNRGDGTFEEVSKKAGATDAMGYYGLGVIWADYDNDGWPDLFVANDATPNYLYHNNHDGTFTEAGMLAGIALTAEGTEQGNMGVTFGDYNHSGHLSLFVTEFAEQPNALYRNLGPKGFDYVTWNSKLGQPGYAYVGWGTSFFDMDNDGWLDLLAVNGHVFPQVDTAEVGARYRQPILFHRNNRDGTFDEVSEQAGLRALPLQSRRGAAFGDVNNDGNIEILILNVGEPPSILVNTTPNSNHRALFKLIGTISNRAAIGARVAIRSGGVTQFDEVRGGSSYLSQNDLRLHFGLGSAARIDSVEIRWPSGKVETLENLPADAIYTVVESAGIKESKSLSVPKSVAPEVR